MGDTRFTDLDLQSSDDGGVTLRFSTTALFGLATLALAASFGFDYAVDSSFVALRQYDWPLTLAVLALIFYGVVPLVRHPERTRSGLLDLLSDPKTLLGTFVVLVAFVVGLVGPFVYPEPTVNITDSYQPPVFMTVPTNVMTGCVGAVADGLCHGTWRYPLGTGRGGFDVLVWSVHGLRVTTAVALVSGLVIVCTGTLVGTVAGYVGGRTDELLMRYVDVQQVVPAFLVYIVLRLVLEGSLFALVFVFGLLNWGGTARLVRSETRTVAETGYVTAARAAGARRWAVIRSHVLPNVAGAALTSATNRAGTLVLAEASLAFLGLGPPGPHSLGRLAAMEIDTLQTFPWISTVPVAILAVVALSLGVMGEGIRGAFDPRAE